MDNEERLNALINRLVASSDSEEAKRLYAEWAETYEGDLNGFGYVAPQLGTAIFSNLLPCKESLIFDAGCGTGLVGQYLAQLGYRRIHGGDFSVSMIAEAQKLAVYERLIMADFSHPLEMASDLYDGIIAIGVYSSRFKEDFLPEMVRILKSGGPMTFSCRGLYYEDDVKEQLDEMLAARSITNLSISEKPYMKAQNANAYYISFRKT